MVSDRDLTASLVVHELRNTLQSVQSFVGLVLHERLGPLNPMQEEFLASAFVASQRLERLVHDAQVMFAGDSGFPLRVEPVELREVVRLCVREMRRYGDEHGTRIDAVVEPFGSHSIVADRNRIEQIILNLLDNAIHYADPGTTVMVRLRRSRSRVLVVVENQVDSGDVVDPHAWLAPLHRERAAQERRPDGWGLGLTVVDTLVRAHGGRMVVRGRGQMVSIGFVLPAAEPDATQPAFPLARQCGQRLADTRRARAPRAQALRAGA